MSAYTLVAREANAALSRQKHKSFGKFGAGEKPWQVAVASNSAASKLPICQYF